MYFISQDEFNTIRGQQIQWQKRREMRQGRKMGMRPQARCRGMGAYNMPKFEGFDQNNNGLLTAEELNRGIQQHMRMSQGQGRNMGRGRNKPNFKNFDGNNDGFISEQELIEKLYYPGKRS